MANKSILKSLLTFLPLLVLLSCNKEDTAVTALTALNCNATTLSTNAFSSNGTVTNTTLTVGLSNALAGSATFAISSSNNDFSPVTYTTTLTAGQSSVAIPLVFDGTSSVTSETITITSSYASGTCTAIATITGSSSGTTTPGTSGTGLAGVVAAAEAFKATLSTTQVASLQLAYTKTDAVKWSNFPQPATTPPRVGLKLGLLSTTQLEAFKTLMTLVMQQNVPNEGYDELEGIRAADDQLASITGKTSTFGSGNYYIAFLGTPSTTGLWELQYGGHHYAFANTYNEGKITGATPSFRGSEPSTAFTQNSRTYQPMEQERVAFASLLTTLSSAEQASAKNASSFSDILLGPGKDGQFPATRQGVAVGALSADKKALVLTAIKLYVNDLDPETAAAIVAKYTTELDNTYLTYAGSGAMNTKGDYIRIDGPSVWIEYSTQGSTDIPGGIHPHSVWRDRTSDYGGN